MRCPAVVPQQYTRTVFTLYIRVGRGHHGNKCRFRPEGPDKGVAHPQGSLESPRRSPGGSPEAAKPA